MRGLHTSFDSYEAEIREILKTLIENGRGIELNVNRGNTPLPDAKWLRIYRELGGELITLGTDALSVGPVGGEKPPHQSILGEGIAIIETLKLEGVEPGRYFLSAAPVKIAGSDGAPVRAVLIAP